MAKSKTSNKTEPQTINGEGSFATTTGTGESYSTSINPPVYYGWVCPKCGRVNAPWKSICDCYKESGGYTPPNIYPFTPAPTTPWGPNKPLNPGPMSPWDPNQPYQWGDIPPFTSPFTCGPGGGLGTPIPCNIKKNGTGDYVNLNMNNSISTSGGGNPNIRAYN